MIRNIDRHKILWLLLAVLSLIVAGAGVFYPSVYADVFSDQLMPGTIAQDIMTLAAALILIACLAGMRRDSVMRQIIALGIVAYLFYAYGVYVIDRAVNALYFLYMAIFALSFYTLVYGLASIRPKALLGPSVPKVLRYVSAGFCLLLPLVFYPLWSSQIIPLIRNSDKAADFYSVYILDLCFIMPAFIIIAVLLIRRKGLGLVLTPAVFVLGSTLLLPVGLGELLKPRYGLPVDMGALMLFLSLAALFIILAVIFLVSLSKQPAGDM